MRRKEFHIERLVGQSAHGPVVVLDTLCYPARYYAGLVTSDGAPVDNVTCNFHRTIGWWCIDEHFGFAFSEPRNTRGIGSLD